MDRWGSSRSSNSGKHGGNGNADSRNKSPLEGSKVKCTPLHVLTPVKSQYQFGEDQNLLCCALYMYCALGPRNMDFSFGTILCDCQPQFCLSFAVSFSPIFWFMFPL